VLTLSNSPSSGADWHSDANGVQNEDMPELLDNGERMIPAYHADTLVYAEHITRYRFAGQFVAGKSVLDVASGSGYGSELLMAAGATRVVGVDCAREAVEYSLGEHAVGEPDYVVGDAEEPPLRTDAFDVIVSFETLEHVYDPGQMLGELRRVLKDDGLLVISTPNKGVYLEGNPFHTHEMTYEEFIESLGKHFKNVHLLAQDNWLASALLDETQMKAQGVSMNDATDLYKAVARDPSASVYMVAICSNAALPPAEAQVTLTTAAEVERHVRELADVRIEMIRTQEAAQAENERLDRMVREREGSLRSEMDRHRETTERLRQQDELVVDLTNRLNAIYGSTGYRMLGGYRKVTRFLFPPDSIRGVPYRMTMRGVRFVFRAGRRGKYLTARGNRARTRLGTKAVVTRVVQKARSGKAVDPVKYALGVNWHGAPGQPETPRRRKDGEPITINWLVPTVSEGGGLRTIFRFVEYFKQRGYKQRLYEMPIGRPMRARPEELWDEARKLFGIELDEVSLDFENMADADAIFATSWHTAYPVLKHVGTGRKLYFVQDFEPFFAPASTESALAENTYRFGFHGVTAGPWLASKLSAEYEMRCDAFNLAVDPLVYYPKQLSSQKRVFYYARPATPRRGFELGMQTLEVFHKRHPEYEIVLAGGEIPHGSWNFPMSNRGYLSEPQMNDLYNQCSAALVISLTNCSLLPLEIMAAGCPVVSNDGPNNEMLVPVDSVVFALPTVHALADALERAVGIDDRERLVGLARQYRWEDQFARVEQIVLDAVGEAAPA
jgi:2-polyprenyl-3-methyl-5-hydroxy-6-metoxy-1,4-benzoquinol methylase